MLNKIKSLPHKTIFAIGMSFIFVAPLMDLIISNRTLELLIKGILFGAAGLFIAIASDKRHSNR